MIKFKNKEHAKFYEQCLGLCGCSDPYHMMSVQRIVIAMNAVFWGMKPGAPRPEQKETV